MTEVQYIKSLLEANWQQSITGRSNDVPQPTFTLEKQARDKRISAEDRGYVASGGDTEYTPQGLGWTHERVDTVVVIEYRAANRNTDAGVENGYERLYGQRTGTDGLQAPDRWAGITGETRRVLLDKRKGHAEWSLVGAGQGGGIRVDDTDLGGKNYWRADVYVPLTQHADSIDPSI